MNSRGWQRPHLRPREYEFKDLLERALQVTLDYSHIASAFRPPPGFFLAEFEDATRGEVLDAYLRHVSVPAYHHVELDESTMTLTVGKTWIGAAKAW